MAKTRRKTEINDSLVQDIIGVGTLILGAILLVGVITPHSGRFGEALGSALKIIAGLGAYVVPALLMFLGGIILVGLRRPAATKNAGIGSILLFVVFVSWCQFAHTPNVPVLMNNASRLQDGELLRHLQMGGGWLGLGLTYALESVFGRICSYIVLIGVLLVSILLITGIRFADLISMITDIIRSAWDYAPQARKETGKVREKDRRVAESARRIEDKPKERPEILSILKLKRQPESEEQTDVVKGSVVIHSGNVEKAKAPAPVIRPSQPHDDSSFQLPPVTLLNEPKPAPKRAQAELNYKIDKIEQTLEEFKIEADVVEVANGPTVTRYEIQLAPGIKVSKIVSLADNLAMSLAAIDVRVEAPIPGKSAIGVEVPNDNPAVVSLREVIETNEFWNAPTKLTFVLGKDVAGMPRFADLTKMPHMLIAGATNAGKSVCLNALIASLLFRATPREVKLILIDPKRVELSVFDGIPHLCCPVVKDVRQAAGILRTAIKEMENRYDRFVQVGAKNFDSYNQKVKPEDRIPYIVIVVDELADLMMQAGPEVEFSICRLAQLARATGIHLVIATQRPSVDVVTGTIKANISSRISFAVSSQIDSRTILDASGAERLIGRGDMLFKPIDASKPTRIQGCFVTEKEVEDVVKHLKEQESPDYTMEPSVVGEGPGGGGGGEANDAMTDEVYEPAVRLVVTSGYASTSMIQRRFKIGYTRAARLVDAMEEQGIVGPLDGAKPREVLIGKNDLDRLFGGSLFANADDDDAPDIEMEEE